LRIAITSSRSRRATSTTIAANRVSDYSGRFYFWPGVNDTGASRALTITVIAYDGELYSESVTLTFVQPPAE